MRPTRGLRGPRVDRRGARAAGARPHSRHPRGREYEGRSVHAERRGRPRPFGAEHGLVLRSQHHVAAGRHACGRHDRRAQDGRPRQRAWSSCRRTSRAHGDPLLPHRPARRALSDRRRARPIAGAGASSSRQPASLRDHGAFARLHGGPGPGSTRALARAGPHRRRRSRDGAGAPLDQPARNRARDPGGGFLRRDPGPLRLRPHVGPSRPPRADPRRPLARRAVRLARQGSQDHRSSRRWGEAAGGRRGRRLSGRKPSDLHADTPIVLPGAGAGHAAGGADRSRRRLRLRRADCLAAAGRRRRRPHRRGDQRCADPHSRTGSVRQGARHPVRADGARPPRRRNPVAGGRSHPPDARPHHRARREPVVFRDDHDGNRPEVAGRSAALVARGRRRGGRGLRPRRIPAAPRRRARARRLRSTECQQLLRRAGAGLSVPGHGPAGSLADRLRGHRARVAGRPGHSHALRPVRGLPRRDRLHRPAAHRMARRSAGRATLGKRSDSGHRSGRPRRGGRRRPGARVERRTGPAPPLDGSRRRRGSRRRVRPATARSSTREPTPGYFGPATAAEHWDDASDGLPGTPVRCLSAICSIGPSSSSPEPTRGCTGRRTPESVGSPAAASAGRSPLSPSSPAAGSSSTSALPNAASTAARTAATRCLATTLTHGDVRALAVDPRDRSVWAAADGSVFRSTDKGWTWASSGAFGTPVLGLAFDLRGTALYAATAGDGLFVTTDAGATWKQDGPRERVPHLGPRLGARWRHSSRVRPTGSSPLPERAGRCRGSARSSRSPPGRPDAWIAGAASGVLPAPTPAAAGPRRTRD